MCHFQPAAPPFYACVDLFGAWKIGLFFLFPAWKYVMFGIILKA